MLKLDYLHQIDLQVKSVFNLYQMCSNILNIWHPVSEDGLAKGYIGFN